MSIVAKLKRGRGLGKIAHDMGLNLGKVVNDAHRSSLKNSGKQLEQEKTESSKPSIIPGAGIPENSIVYRGITPVPSAPMSPQP
jgi:hypothetical protein